MDEIEKAVGGHSSSGHTDGGVTLGMLGTVLTWMQEHESPVTVIATCNDYSKLPAELTRAGRFDERFFLDLPSQSEREGVALVHLERLRCSVSFADAISAMTNEWTPAEIEQLVKSAARRTKRELNLQVLESCAKEIIPISKSSNLQQMREWAATNLRKANDLDTVDLKPMRRVGRGK
jgi:SpoVK/Ycf46/Vps4 family AAA+-type ATPase